MYNPFIEPLSVSLENLFDEYLELADEMEENRFEYDKAQKEYLEVEEEAEEDPESEDLLWDLDSRIHSLDHEFLLLTEDLEFLVEQFLEGLEGTPDGLTVDRMIEILEEEAEARVAAEELNLSFDFDKSET